MEEEEVEEIKNEAKANPGPSSYVGDDDKAKGEETSVHMEGVSSTTKAKATKKSIPPPGTGQKIYEIDPMLNGFREHLDYRLDTLPCLCI